MMKAWKAPVMKPYCWVLICRFSITVGAATAKVARDRKLTIAPSMIRAIVSQRMPKNRRMIPPVVRPERRHVLIYWPSPRLQVDGRPGNGNANFYARKDKYK